MSNATNGGNPVSTIVLLRWYNTILTSGIALVLSFALVKLDRALSDIDRNSSDIRVLNYRQDVLDAIHKADVRDLKEIDKELKDAAMRKR